MLGVALALQLQEAKAVLLLSLTDITVGSCVQSLTFMCQTRDVGYWREDVVDKQIELQLTIDDIQGSR